MQEQAELLFESRSLFAVVAAVFIATPSLAREVYECDFPARANNLGYLPDVVMMARETGSDTVTVVEPFIQYTEGGPIEGKIAEENDKKLSVSWTIMQESTVNDYEKVHYRVSVQKSSLSASLVGRALGYSNNFTSQGTCKRMTG
ncbi:MAG: hypothetical protein C0524_08740 [Rhodobacter sp.]|nr:hypothetical protein [Rhodobacter sp.]